MKKRKRSPFDSLPFDLEVVGSAHLYPWFGLGLPSSGQRFPHGLDPLPYKKESEEFVDGCFYKPYLGYLEGKK